MILKIKINNFGKFLLNHKHKKNMLDDFQIVNKIILYKIFK